jgi:site-specific DNA-cytosine methylase
MKFDLTKEIDVIRFQKRAEYHIGKQSPNVELIEKRTVKQNSYLHLIIGWFATESGIAIEVYETDSEPMRRIKKFMAIYGIADIKMRMLKIPELKRIMGFPEDYTLIGTQAEQKKYIGNAVEVNMSLVMCEALVTELYSMGILKTVAW